ncbi:MAG: hypothetical protein ABFC42_05415 [Sulfuricella sp.]
MPEYIVTRKTDGAEIYRYNADAPIEWSGMEFDSHEHREEPSVVTENTAPVDPARWRIYVGSFFDRFGGAKLAILSDPDPVVQAVIKDASVRNYIDLLGRRDELLKVIGLLNMKGHAVDAVAVLDVEPNNDEVWRG